VTGSVIATPEYLPPRPISSICIGTPSKLAPPSFGRAIAEIVFMLRTHGIECREAKTGLTLLGAYLGHPHKKPDAVLWIDGNVDFRVEDVLALVDGVRHRIDVVGLMVPVASEAIDWARVRQAVKRRASLDELACAGLSYDVKLFDGEQKTREVNGRRFREVKHLGCGCVILHADAIVVDPDEVRLSGPQYVLEGAPAGRRLPEGPPLLCKEPEWMLSELERRQRPLVEGNWRAAMRRGFVITTVAFNDKVADIFAPVTTMLAEGLKEIGFEAWIARKNTFWNASGPLALGSKGEPPIHIILGAHIAQPDVDIPEGSIFFCCEQPAPDWIRFIKSEAELFRPSVIWSWAEVTTHLLKAAGLPAVTLPLGFVKGLAPLRLEGEVADLLIDTPKDIDVLFYGGLTQRRREILGALQQKGLRVHYEKACWGVKREELIARSKVVLNIRGNDFGPEGGVFEAVRALPLIARGVAVVSEKGEGWDRFQSGCRFVDSPSEIPDAVSELVGDDDLRSFLEKESVKAAMAQPQSYFLKQLFGVA